MVATLFIFYIDQETVVAVLQLGKGVFPINTL
jgi:hypothetical protein